MFLSINTISWEQCKLGKYAQYRRGSFPQPYGKKEWYDGENSMPFVQVADVTDKMKLVDKTKQRISKLAQPMSIFVPKGSVVVTLQGSIGRVAITQFDAYLDRTVLFFEDYKFKTDLNFWGYIIQNKFEEEAKHAPGGTIKTITKEALSDFDLIVPKYSEQNKIGELFNSIDKLITLHQSKLNKIVDMKKSLLEKIFPQNNSNVPALRFKYFNDAWEQRKLGDACKINGRIGFRGYTEKDIITKDAGGVLTFSPTNIIDNKLTMDCKNTYITREKYEESPEIMIKNGDILFVKTGSTLGKSTLVTGLEEDASINPQIVVMRTEKGTESFLSSVLITQDVLKQVAEVKIGGAVPTMTETELKNFIYSEPSSKEEKSKIGIFFRRLDNLITLHLRE